MGFDKLPPLLTSGVVPPDDNGHSHVINNIIWAVIALFGGVAHYLDAFLKGTHPTGWAKFSAHTFVSAFSGYMAANVIFLYKPEFTFIVAGVAGYLGPQVLEFISLFIQKKIGISLEPVKNDSLNNNPPK